MQPLCLLGQGLKFSGLECRIDERTSLEVFGDRPKTFQDLFEMEFMISTFPKADFGYIFRIKESDYPNRIWNLSYDGRGKGQVAIRINEEGRFSLIKATFPREDMQDMHWTHVRIAFDMQKDSVYLDIAGHRYSAAADNLPDRLRTEICFGKSDHIIDVPAFAIRDLTIRDRHRSHTFKFDEVSGHTARDTRGTVKAKVGNPVWMTEESIHWKQLASMKFQTNAGAVYNRHRKEFYYFNRDKILIADMMAESISEIEFARPCPMDLVLASSFISEDGSTMYTYELQYEDRDSTRCSIASLDLDSMEWTCRSHCQLKSPMHHHTSFRTGEGYTVFGGFGEMKYNGKFYQLGCDMQWKEIWDNSGSTLFPRYFTSGGIDESGRYVYIFGGMGNESGEQIVGRHYYYDLHRIDTKTGKCERLWDLEWKQPNIVPVRNMTISGDYMYTLCYPEHISDSQLHLYRFSISDGTFEMLDDPIQITSDKILTNANLWYDNDLKKLYASVQVFDDDIKSELNLYSLSFPPVFPGRKSHSSAWWILTLAIALAAGCAAGGPILLRRKRKLEMQDSCEAISEKKFFRQGIRGNSIYLFGDFMVFDKEGKDITLTFTKQQRQLLCLLLKYSDKDGISSKKLSNILWPDKDENKAKNSRGVAINNMRKLLKPIDGISLISNDAHFKLEYGPGFYCDYLELMELLSADSPDKIRILEIISKGKFMTFMNEPVFDTFKEKVENSIAPILQKEIIIRYNSREYLAVTEIAEMIFNVDPLNEHALEFLIRSLRKLKRNDDALVQYATFAAEYRKVYDSEYDVPFEKIV
ncbi:MAG: DNA-binding transcriptional activator [Bacteroides sp.]|nr:DNA-binding transcriptional activator [Bacteroides sp.]